MQEINLLRNQLKDTTAIEKRQIRVITNILVLVLILELTVAGGLTLLNLHTKDKIAAVKGDNAQIQTDLTAKQKDLSGAVSFQAQLVNLRKLITGHVSLSPLLDQTSRTTFKGTQYLGLTAETTGKVHMEGRVGSYTDLGKLLLGLATADKVTDVNLLSSSPAQGQLSGFLFSIDLMVKKDLFYKN